MINFEEELKRFKPSLEIEDVEDIIYNQDLDDMSDVLLKMLKEAKETEDAYAMIGAFASSAVKNLKTAPNSKRNKNIVKELAKIDNLSKTTKFSENPWLLVESFILRLEKM